MALVESLFPIIQLILGSLLIAGILLQQRGTGLGGAFGGETETQNFNTRRGAEKGIFQGTIVVAVLFVLSAILALVI